MEDVSDSSAKHTTLNTLDKHGVGSYTTVGMWAYKTHRTANIKNLRVIKSSDLNSFTYHL